MKIQFSSDLYETLLPSGRTGSVLSLNLLLLRYQVTNNGSKLFAHVKLVFHSQENFVDAQSYISAGLIEIRISKATDKLSEHVVSQGTRVIILRMDDGHVVHQVCQNTKKCRTSLRAIHDWERNAWFLNGKMRSTLCLADLLLQNSANIPTALVDEFRFRPSRTDEYWLLYESEASGGLTITSDLLNINIRTV